MIRRGGGNRTTDAHRPSARGWRRALVIVLLLALVAAPVVARRGVATARRDRDRAQAAARVARQDRLDAERAITTADAVRTRREAQADKASQQASDARVALAEAGVSERALRQALDEAEAAVHAVEKKDQAMAARLERQAADLPLALGCIDEVVRVLGRASQAAATGAEASGLEGACADLGRRTSGATG